MLNFKKSLNEINIGVLDSGVGGITIFYELSKLNVFNKLIYLGDNKNSPYGNKTVDELFYLTKKNVQSLINNGANIIVFACNTLSASILPEIKRFFDVPFFGVYPPVKHGKNTLLIATPVTLSNPKYKNVNAIALKNFAKEIESNIFNLEKVDLNKIFSQIKRKYKTIILGCTHYMFLQNKVSAYFNNAKILSGNQNTVKTILKTIKRHKPINNIYSLPKILFIGDSAEKNKAVFEKLIKNLLKN